MYNSKLSAAAPSPNWSREISIQKTSFNRNPLVSDIDENILFLDQAYGDEKGLKIKLFNNKMELLKEEKVYISQLEFNTTSSQEVFLDGKYILWRDNNNNTVYRGEISDDLKTVQVKEIMNNVEKLDYYSDGKKGILAFLKKDGMISICRGDGETIFDGEISGNIKDLKVYSQDENIYLQTVNYNNKTGIKEYRISQCRDGIMSDAVTVWEISEIGMKVRDFVLCGDGENIYSLITTQGKGANNFGYILAGYNKSTEKSFEPVKFNDYPDMGLGYFYSNPVVIGENENGIEILVGGTTYLDLYSREKTNIVKVGLNRKGINKTELISKTKGLSIKPSYVKGKDGEVCFWLEPDEGKYFKVMAATTDKSVLLSTTKINSNDVKEALGKEVPSLTSYLLLISFAGRFLPLLPVLGWLIYIFSINERIEKSGYKYLIIGIFIYLFFQIITINSFYKPEAVLYMPKLLTFTGSKIIIPTVFSLVGLCAVIMSRKKDRIKQPYKQYILFLTFAYILMNYLYTPYLFINN